MSTIVRTITRVITPAILLFGVYLVIHGHITPGGGFQGGAVFASGIALLLVAFNAQQLKEFLREDALSAVESTGALLFILLAFGGMATTTFFANFLLGSPLFGGVPPSGPGAGDFWTGGTLPPMNVAVGLKVGAGLSAILVTLMLATSKTGGSK